jgi:hypothetical protein
MASVDSKTEPEPDGSRTIVSTDPTPEERAEAYRVSWRDPADSPSLADRLRRLF